MIDLGALLLTHGLLALAAWRLVNNPALDADAPPADKGQTPGA